MPTTESGGATKAVNPVWHRHRRTWCQTYRPQGTEVLFCLNSLCGQGVQGSFQLGDLISVVVNQLHQSPSSFLACCISIWSWLKHAIRGAQQDWLIDERVIGTQLAYAQPFECENSKFALLLRLREIRSFDGFGWLLYCLACIMVDLKGRSPCALSLICMYPSLFHVSVETRDYFWVIEGVGWY